MFWNDRYEKVLQDCLVRVLEGSQPLEKVVSRYPAWREQLTAQLELALHLQNQQKYFDPKQGFVTASRQQLMTRLNQAAVPHPGRVRSSAFSRGLIPRLAVMLVAFLVIFLSGGGFAVAAGDALPGQALYPVRTGLEEVRLVLTFDQARRGELHLQFAQEYLVACAVLTSRGHTQEAYLALQQYDRHISGTSRILISLSGAKSDDLQALLAEFNRIILQDFGVVQALFPGSF